MIEPEGMEQILKEMEADGDIKLVPTDIPSPGKFELNDDLNVSEYLYGVVQDGAVVEQYGSVDEQGWHGLIDTKLVIDTDTQINPEGWFALNVLKPAYIVEETDQGFFIYREFADFKTAQQTFIFERDRI